MLEVMSLLELNWYMQYQMGRCVNPKLQPELIYLLPVDYLIYPSLASGKNLSL